MKKTFALLLVLATLGFVACGDDDDAAEASGACTGSGIAKSEVQLPADFPQPGELTITKSVKAGPSQVLDGYWDSGLDEAYTEWQREFETAGYTILFKEKEEDDAEISYKSADGSTTGQVAFRAECGEGDKIVVHITNRPA